MTTQERAFQAYYSSMTDDELMAIAANRTSFIDVAQKFMAEELLKRNLTATAESSVGQRAQAERSLSANPVGPWGTIRRVVLRRRG
jgi:hypothetical protein